MRKGGSRPGAGRPKGVPNKVTLRREAEIAASGLTPLDYMLGVLRNPKSKTEDRRWAAQTAAPYVHPRLASHSVTSQSDNRLEIVIIDPTRGTLANRTYTVKPLEAKEANALNGTEPEIANSRQEARRASSGPLALPAPPAVGLAESRLGELVDGGGETQHVDSDGADNRSNRSKEGES